MQDGRKHNAIKRRSSIISNKSNNYADDDMQSISTVSGSGMNFFRNVVRKHGTKTKENTKSKTKNDKENTKTTKDGKSKKDSECKDCESQFRQKVLIERLVSDTMLNKAWLAGGGLPPSRLAKELNGSHDKCQDQQHDDKNDSGNLQYLSSIDSNSNFSPSKGSSIGIMVSSISNASTSCESRCAVHQSFLNEANGNDGVDEQDEVLECDSISSVPYN